MQEFAQRMTEGKHPIRGVPQPDGSVMFIQEVDFEPVAEPWSRYDLKDGGQIRARQPVGKIYQVFDPDPEKGEGHFKPRLDNTGEPQFFIFYGPSQATFWS